MVPVYRQPAWLAFICGRLFATLGTQVVSVAVGWQVYALTGRALDLGLVGLVQFLPQLVLFPLVGTLVDRLPRNRTLLAAYVLYAAGSCSLAALAASGAASREAIFGAVLLVALGRSLANPSAQALLPQLVSTADFPRAVALGSSLFQLAIIVGPAAGGLVYALLEGEGAGDPDGGRGAVGAYGIAATLHLLALGTAALLPARRAAFHGKPPGLAEALDGLRFIWRRKILLSAISLDLFAVLFGGAVALLPMFAKDVLDAGPTELGMLRAAPAVGALLMALALGVRPLTRRLGPTLYATVAVFGLATLVFALSEHLWLSLLALAITGAADEISVFIRLTVVQVATPDAMRGRVSAAEFVFIGASNELGEFESGLTASWWGPVGAAAVGGLGTLVAVGISWLLSHQLRGVDRLDDVRPNSPEGPAG